MTEQGGSLRIAHVVDFYMDGFGYQENLLPKWHARHGHDSHVVTSDRYVNNGHYEDTFGAVLGDRIVGPGIVERDGYSVHRLRSVCEWRTRIWLRGLRRKISDIQPDVIMAHSTTSPTAFRLARIAKSMGIPLVIDSHMVFSVADNSPVGRGFYRGLKWLTALLLTPHVTRYYGVAQECCDFLVQAQGVPPAKVNLLPLGVDGEIFQPDAAGGAEVRKALGLAKSDLLVLQTGKMTRDKGPDYLARAIAPIMVDYPEVHVLFLGSGDREYANEVRSSLLDSNVADRAHWLPLVPVEQLSSYFSAADVTVFPRASSLSSLEAAGCGSAVVMTDLPAGQWRAESGVGVTFETDNVNSLREVLERLLLDGEMREHLAARALESIQQNYSYDAVATNLEQDFHAII